MGSPVKADGRKVYRLHIGAVVCSHIGVVVCSHIGTVVRSYIVLYPSSVKNRSFLTASPQGEAFGRKPWVRRKSYDYLRRGWCSAQRIYYGRLPVAIAPLLIKPPPYPSSVKNRRFLTAPPQGEAFGRKPWVRRKPYDYLRRGWCDPQRIYYGRLPVAIAPLQIKPLPYGIG